MVQGDEFEFQRRAAANPEQEQATEGGQKGNQAHDGMAVARERDTCAAGLTFEHAQKPYHAGMKALPDHLENYERESVEFPFRLVVPPARGFLNTTFTETPGSVAREVEPRALIHHRDAARLGIVDGELVRLGNARGEVTLRARPLETARPGVVVVEGNWPSEAFVDHVGINVLIGSDPVPPNGGAAFHDTAVWIRVATPGSD